MRNETDDDGGAPTRERTQRDFDDLGRAVARELPVRSDDPDSGGGDAAEGMRGPPEAAPGWPPSSPRPYLAATGIALIAMVLLVATTALPAPEVFQIGLTFLAVAMGVRRLQDIPYGGHNPLLAWLHDRADDLAERFGVEFYGIAGLTAFLRAEADLVTDLSVGDLLANPLGAAISWFISALVESIVNAIWSALWWVQLMRVIDGWPLFLGIVGAGWLVWRILDITPRGEEE